MLDCKLPQIGDITPGQDGYRETPTGQLSGKEYVVHYGAQQPSINYKFLTGNRLTITFINSQQELNTSLELYEAFEIDKDLYFIDLNNQGNQKRHSVSLIYDLNRSQVLEIKVVAPFIDQARSDLLARITENNSTSAMKIHYRHGVIENGSESEKQDDTLYEYLRTDKLVGKRLLCTYSDTHVYDHIYLNKDHFCWYCLKGPDKGLGDYDECDYFELAPNIYLICWREKLLPMTGIIVENHTKMRSLGKIYGLDVNSNKTENITVGANLKLLNETHY